MVLWIIFAGLTAAALVTVLYPFLRTQGAGSDAAAYDTAVFKDQLEEITAEEERGVISKVEAEAARTEVSRRLLATSRSGKTENADATAGRAGHASTAALISAFLFVPVMCTALYLIYGSPGLSDQPLGARLNAPDGSQKVEALVAKVETRLRDHPDDGRGWEVVAPVYLRQRRFADAANAFGKAARLLGETPQRLVDYGNALVLANNGLVVEPARKALEKALAADASLIRAHFWLAVAKEQNGQFVQAVEAWRKLLAKGNDSAPWRKAVEQRLAVAETKAGTRKDKPVTEVASGSDALKGPSQEEVAAAREMTATDRSAMIKQMVSGLAERLRSDGGSVDEWQRLVRSYMVLEDKQAAANALSEARGAFKDDPKALAALASLATSLGI